MKSGNLGLLVLIPVSMLLAFGNSKAKAKRKADDGSEFVCRILKNSLGIDSCYHPDQVRNSKKWKKQDYPVPVPGAIAVWTDYMAIIDPFNKQYLSSIGPVAIEEVDEVRGKPEFYMPVKDSVPETK